MPRGAQLQALLLTVQENNQLIEWTRRHKCVFRTNVTAYSGRR